MRTFVTAVVTAIGLVWLGTAIAPGTAHAAPLRCSADSSFDPVAASDVIIGGRITSWEPRDDLSWSTTYIPVELHIDVTHVWKGRIAPGEAIVDRASLLNQPGDGTIWGGGGGACGAIDHDPEGMYAVLGLSRTDDGYLRTNRLTTFWLSPEPYDPAALSDPSRRHFQLPALGDGGADATTQTHAMLWAALGTFALGVGAMIRGRRSDGRS